MIKTLFATFLVFLTTNMHGQNVNYRHYKLVKIDSVSFQNCYIVSFLRTGKLYKVISKRNDSDRLSQSVSIEKIKVGKSYDLNLEQMDYYYSDNAATIPLLGSGVIVIGVDTNEILKRGECFYRSNNIRSIYFIK